MIPRFTQRSREITEVCPVLQQEVKKRTVWLNEEKQIVSFHFVDGYRQEDLVCYDDFFIRFLQSLQAKGYRFQ